MIIDAHQHFWQRDLPFDYQWLKQAGHERINDDFLPADLQPLLESSGVRHSVFVQTQHNLEENRWTLRMCQENDFLLGVVGWVDLADKNVESQLEEFLGDDYFVGIRHITQDEPDADFIVHPEILRGLKVLQRHRLPFDLLFFEKHLRHATTVAQAVPDLPLVIDHLAKPNIAEGSWQPWANELEAASKYPNVYAKISGLITEADWSDWKTDDLRRYVDHALECFGPQRLMFGSDWPVCRLAGTYSQVHEACAELIGGLSESEQDWIWWKTANSFYQLGVEA